MRQRGIDFQRFLSLGFLPIGVEDAQRAHVVQPIGQLDHQDTNIAGHRDDHLSYGFGLSGVAIFELVELGYSINEFGYFIAEGFTQFRQRIGRVFHGVVEQCSDQHRNGHP